MPLIVPIFITLVLGRLSLASRASRERLRALETDQSSVERLVDIIAKLEHDVESAVVNMIDDPGDAPSTANGSPSPELGLIKANPKTEQVAHTEGFARPQYVILTDLQLRLVKLLNTLPNLKKELAFIHPVRNSHGPIICRDTTNFAFHKLGEGVLRHWADHFVM